MFNEEDFVAFDLIYVGRDNVVFLHTKRVSETALFFDFYFELFEVVADRNDVKIIRSDSRIRPEADQTSFWYNQIPSSVNVAIGLASNHNSIAVVSMGDKGQPLLNLHEFIIAD